MKLFGCEQRKVFAQIEARLCTEDRQRAGAGAIRSRGPFFQDEAKKIVYCRTRNG